MLYKNVICYIKKTNMLHSNFSRNNFSGVGLFLILPIQYAYLHKAK